MRHIDQQRGAVCMAEGLQPGQVGCIRVHAEEALGDDQDAVGAVARADAGQQFLHVAAIKVAMHAQVARGGARALAQRCMRVLVDDDMIHPVHERGDGAERRAPAGRK